MTLYPHFLLQVFAKSPQLGKVKTRLQPAYSQQFSLQLHQQLVNYCLQHWTQANVCPLELWIAGDQRVFNKYLAQWQFIDRHSQQGGDLGERLWHATCTGLSKPDIKGTLLVGTDCPFIDKAYLQAACASLEKHDVVIGSAKDGGYVLLGIKQVLADLFTDICWGESTVFEETLAKVKKNELSYSLLPPLNDIDRPEDIALLPF